MKKTPKEIIEVFASFLKKSGMEEGKVAALFNAEGTELKDNFDADVTTFDTERVKKLKTDSNKEGFDKGFKDGNSKGFKDGSSKWEQEAKEKFELESDKQGLELIEEIVTKKSNVKLDLEEDKVKAHAVYINMQKELNKKIKDQEKAFTTEKETLQKDFSRKETLTGVLTDFERFVKDEKYIISTDAKRAKNQMKLGADALNTFEFERNDDVEGGFVIKKDGKVYQDERGNAFKLSDVFRETADSNWDKEQGTGRSSAGNNNDGAAGGGKGAAGGKATAPKNEQEYISRIRSAKTPQERIDIDDAWKSVQEGAQV